MKLHLEQNDKTNRITGYEKGLIFVNKEPFQSSLILTPDSIIADWQPQTPDELSRASLQPVLNLHPDVLIVGTGSLTVFLDRATIAELYRAGIGVETMDTAAACRSYNILMDEGRNVAAALLMIK